MANDQVIIPLSNLPTDDFMAIGYCKSDQLVLLYGGQPEIDAVRSAIVETWSKGVKSETVKLADPKRPETATRVYVFEINAKPFSEGDKHTSIDSYKMAAKVLFNMNNKGWKLLASSDASVREDHTTWFFQRHKSQSMTSPLLTVAIHMTDKMKLVNCSENLHGAITNACVSNWSKGMQEQKMVSDSNYEMKLKGNPWLTSDAKETLQSRNMVKQIINVLNEKQWRLYGNSGVKEYGETLFFQHDPSMQGDVGHVAMCVHGKDRLRFLDMPSAVASALEETVRKSWSAGVQAVNDIGPNCHELKLKGTPWWSNCDEANFARLLIVRIMEKLSSLGYVVETAIDMSRGRSRSKDMEKAMFLFRKVEPISGRFFCLALQQDDVIRLLNAPQNIIDAGRVLIDKWYHGVDDQKDLLHEGVSYQVVMRGAPWHSMYSGDGVMARALLLGLLNIYASLGWRLVCCADVSSQYIFSNKALDYPLDVQSWYFMYDETLKKQ